MLLLSQISAPGGASARRGLSVWSSVIHQAGRQGLSLIGANSQDVFSFSAKAVLTPVLKDYMASTISVPFLCSEKVYPHNNTHHILATRFSGIPYTFS